MDDKIGGGKDGSDMATGRMNRLVIMVSLCSSIVEGIEHLIASEANKGLRRDAMLGLAALEENLKEFQADSSVIDETKRLEALLKSWLFAYDRDFKKHLYQWYCMVLKELRNLMVAETERCPVCGGKGSPYYGAVLYEEYAQEENQPLKPIRVYMKCRDCQNYYLAKDEAGPGEPEKSLRTRPKCQRLLAFVREFVSQGPVLFMGEETSQLYKEARKAGFEPELFSEEACDGKGEGRYRLVLIECIAVNQDVKEVLTSAAKYLDDDGVLWFDGPDLDKSFRSLKKRGVSLWKKEAPEVCLTDEGIQALAKECGLSVEAFRHVGRAPGRIEIIAKKENSWKEGMLHGTSHNA